MKIFKLLFWLLAFSFFSTSMSAQKVKTAELKIQTKIYCNHCGSCEDCKPNILTHIEEVKGVKGASLDIKAMTITVFYNPKKTTPDLIRKAVTLAGFEADGIPADPAAYEALDGCCKK